jgi:hypothetical protein
MNCTTQSWISKLEYVLIWAEPNENLNRAQLVQSVNNLRQI